MSRFLASCNTYKADIFEKLMEPYGWGGGVTPSQKNDCVGDVNGQHDGQALEIGSV